MLYIAETYRRILQPIGFGGEEVFTNGAIQPWRTLPDRQNCLWDLPTETGPVRLHVKRFARSRAWHCPARREAEGYGALQASGIPTAELVAWGRLDDGRSFIVTEDLAGFDPADKLIESGFPFARLLAPTAKLAAKLHGAGLHHRDLYLCHFLAREAAGQDVDLRLIDAARVRRLRCPLTRRRWIVKDLAQFWYSTLALAISDEQRQGWLERYTGQCRLGGLENLRRAVRRKSDWIAGHDEKLRRRQPSRNISIPKFETRNQNDESNPNDE